MQKCFKSSQGLPLVWFSPDSLGIVNVFGSEGVSPVSRLIYELETECPKSSSPHKIVFLPCRGGFDSLLALTWSCTQREVIFSW